jgi:hypothetical protein
MRVEVSGNDTYPWDARSGACSDQECGRASFGIASQGFRSMDLAQDAMDKLGEAPRLEGIRWQG